jgi:hypothetical protein
MMMTADKFQSDTVQRLELQARSQWSPLSSISFPPPSDHSNMAEPTIPTFKLVLGLSQISPKCCSC